MSISTASGRWISEVTSPVDRANTVPYACFVGIYRPSCDASTLLSLFSMPKMAEKRFRSLGGVLHGEVMPPSDSLTPIWYRSSLEFFGNLSPFKHYATFFRFARKLPFDIFWEGIFPHKRFFHR
jgi:hypothetical protein